MSTRPTIILRTANRARAIERDRRILAIGPTLNSWTERAFQEIMGAAAGEPYQLSHAVDRALLRLARDGAAILEDHLLKLATWGWRSASTNLLRAVPAKAWARKILATATFTEGRAGRRFSVDRLHEARRLPIEFRNDLQDIIDGDLTGDEAMALIRQIEFPPPPRATVRRWMNRTDARDGLSAMQRIVTIVEREKPRLKSIIIETMSGGLPEEKASAIDELSKRIRPFFANDEGINWKARRIARTEGVRIAEDTLRESWQDSEDLFDGIRTFTANDQNVREEHAGWHDKLFKRQADGDYVADDGERLPTFPAGPNCRCWSTPELAASLTKDLPAADYGAGYRRSLDRFERSDAALEI